MGSDSQALQQARKLIGQRDFDGAIDLFSAVDDPTADELFALAESYFLKATSAEDGRKSKAAYREAVKLYPQCYADCAKPRHDERKKPHQGRNLERQMPEKPDLLRKGPSLHRSRRKLRRESRSVSLSW